MAAVSPIWLPQGLQGLRVNNHLSLAALDDNFFFLLFHRVLWDIKWILIDAMLSWILVDARCPRTERSKKSLNHGVWFKLNDSIGKEP